MSEKKSIQTQGATIEDAIQAGLAGLQVDRTDVAINIIDEGARGILGVGKRNAIVELTVLETEIEPVEEEIIPVAEPVVEEIKPIVAEPVVPEPIVVDEPQTEEVKAVAEPAVVAPPAKKSAPKSKPKPKSKSPAPKKESRSKSADEKVAVTVEQLEKELEIAEEVVIDLLSTMGIETSISYEVLDKDDLGERAAVLKLHGGDLSTLIGPRGKVLNDFQLLVRMIVSQQIEGRTHFVIDMDDYREKRNETLIQLATTTAEKVVKFKRPIALNPMPPHERRIIHMTLREDKRVNTQSKGDGSNRRVRILPARSNNSNRGGNEERGRRSNSGSRGGQKRRTPNNRRRKPNEQRQ